MRNMSILALLADIKPIRDPITCEVLGYVGQVSCWGWVLSVSGNTSQEVTDKLNAMSLGERRMPL